MLSDDLIPTLRAYQCYTTHNAAEIGDASPPLRCSGEGVDERSQLLCLVFARLNRLEQDISFFQGRIADAHAANEAAAAMAAEEPKVEPKVEPMAERFSDVVDVHS